MSEIGRVNKHKTTHQDGGDDELVLTGILPGVHKTTHQDAGADEIDATGLAGRINLVDRGDPAAWDFTLTDFTFNSSWNDLDLSAIVPSGAIAALLFVNAAPNDVDRHFKLRKNGNTNQYNMFDLASQVSGVIINQEIIAYLDSNRIVEYWGISGTFTAFNLLVRGWWI